MSNPRAKKEKSLAKDARQLPVEDGKIGSKKRKQHKPICVYYYMDYKPPLGGWSWPHRFATIEQARKYVEKEQRSFGASMFKSTYLIISMLED